MAKEMGVRTFCLPDSVIQKWLHNSHKILETLGAPTRTFLALQDMQVSVGNSLVACARTESGRLDRFSVPIVLTRNFRSPYLQTSRTYVERDWRRQAAAESQATSLRCLAMEGRYRMVPEDEPNPLLLPNVLSSLSNGRDVRCECWARGMRCGPSIEIDHGGARKSKHKSHEFEYPLIALGNIAQSNRPSLVSSRKGTETLSKSESNSRESISSWPEVLRPIARYPDIAFA